MTTQPAQGIRLAMLGWFLLTLLAAGISPLMRPQRIDIVCSSVNGRTVTLAIQTGLETKALSAHGASTLDCPLCLPAHTPPSLCRTVVPTPAPVATQAFRPAPCVLAFAHVLPPVRGPPLPFLV
ncbi:MAG: hypothetical protein IPG98_05555 [Burkholderiales bacterium]|nr:hypothetical protein [Burkholderiales bacterium]MBK8666383.1 hypothetical protein [Burkholderiales bacterium]